MTISECDFAYKSMGCEYRVSHTHGHTTDPNHQIGAIILGFIVAESKDS